MKRAGNTKRGRNDWGHLSSAGAMVFVQPEDITLKIRHPGIYFRWIISTGARKQGGKRPLQYPLTGALSILHRQGRWAARQCPEPSHQSHFLCIMPITALLSREGWTLVQYLPSNHSGRLLLNIRTECSRNEKIWLSTRHRPQRLPSDDRGTFFLSTSVPHWSQWRVPRQIRVCMGLILLFVNCSG